MRRPSTRQSIAPADYVQSLDRGLAVIRAFGVDRSRMTLSEVAMHAQVSRAAARRLLLTLQAIGYVDTEDGKHFVLRPAVLDLGFAYLASQPWWREAQRQIARLATRLGHPCAVGVLDGAEVIYVAYAAPNPVAGMDRSVGTRLPAHATAIGRVLLAGLPPEEAAARLTQRRLAGYTPFTETSAERLMMALDDIRRQGFCIIDQELRLGLRSFCVPIRDRAQQVRAGLSMSYGVMDAPEVATMRAELDGAARAIGGSLTT